VGRRYATWVGCSHRRDAAGPGHTGPVTGPELSFVLAIVVAAAGLAAIVYFAVRGGPGVVGWSPPPGSSRAPVYTFAIAWFIAGFTGRANNIGGGWLWVRLVMLLIAVAAMTYSWRRLRRDPQPPPRI
jgi:hypothetical protein